MKKEVELWGGPEDGKRVVVGDRDLIFAIPIYEPVKYVPEEEIPISGPAPKIGIYRLGHEPRKFIWQGVQ